MNYRPTAAKAALALALLLVPGALFAGNTTTGACTCVDFEEADDVVRGVTTNWQLERLRHTSSTLHVFVGNPDEFQGVCRKIAIKWNLSIFTNKKDKRFVQLLKKSAKANCKIAYERLANPNADGSYDLVSVRPTP